MKQQQTNVTAQSITARKRRRKIANKTQELSKLIPGAHRMNTADMFGAAYKYIKLLKVQVGILDFMASYDQVMNYFTNRSCGSAKLVVLC